MTSQIHPLDSNSVPYNFSSTGSPLLHNAARALNLPARLPVTFNSAFHLSSSPNIAASTTSTSRSSESDSVTIPPVDPQYTGQILVSGYHIAYVLPKHFPSRDHARSEADSDRSSHSLHHKRRLSISDRNHAHFMAAVDMWVPYVTRPPRFPYLVSASNKYHDNHHLIYDFMYSFRFLLLVAFTIISDSGYFHLPIQHHLLLHCHHLKTMRIPGTSPQIRTSHERHLIVSCAQVPTIILRMMNPATRQQLAFLMGSGFKGHFRVRIESEFDGQSQ